MTAQNTRATAERFLNQLSTGGDVTVLFAETVDHYVPGAETVPWTGHRTTRAQVADFFHQLATHLQPRAFIVDHLLVDDQDAVTLGRFDYTVKHNGHPFSGQFALHLTVHRGAIVRYHMYEDSYALERAFTSPA